MSDPAPICPATLRVMLERKGISLSAAAQRLDINRRHLDRVLRGDRPGRRTLVRLAELIDTLPSRRPQEDASRLIDAAIHVFFIKRGRFNSQICDPRK